MEMERYQQSYSLVREADIQVHSTCYASFSFLCLRTGIYAADIFYPI